MCHDMKSDDDAICFVFLCFSYFLLFFFRGEKWMTGHGEHVFLETGLNLDEGCTRNDGGFGFSTDLSFPSCFRRWRFANG